MTKRLIGGLTAAALLLCLTGESTSGPPWFTTTGKLTRIGTGLLDEGVYLTLDVTLQDAKGACAGATAAFMPREAPQYREVYATALLALSQARPIDLYYDDTCWGNAAKLAAVSLRPNP